MARSRRRPLKRLGRKRGPKADWVYRSEFYDTNGVNDFLATYSSGIRVLNTGAAAANGLVLYDSKAHLRARMAGPAGPATVRGGAAASRSEGAKPKMLRVQGQLYVEPQTWTLGNLMAIGVRIAAMEQDAPTGQVIISADYSMWAAGGNTILADWANARRLNLWENRYYRGFASDAQAFMVHSFNVALRVRLDAHEALILYLEGEGTSVNMRYQVFCRTLVVDEGSG